MEPNPQPAHEQAQRDSALAAMDLDQEILHNAVRYGYEEAGRCTGNDVATMARILAWGKPVRSLREQLGPKGWSNGRHPTLESVIHPDRKFQIVSGLGNSFTGTDRMPSTYADKGPQTWAAILDNRQETLDSTVAAFASPASAELATWMLLQYIDDAEQEIRVELSKPTHFTGSRTTRGYIDEFSPRIRLEPVSLDFEATIHDDGPDTDEEDLDIPVIRRA